MLRMICRLIIVKAAPWPRMLEDQMCDFGIDGLSSGESPDRLDALVWAVTELTALANDRGYGPRITALDWGDPNDPRPPMNRVQWRIVPWEP
jgi:hypothetical protein